MVLIGLLIIALACLALGLIYASAPWLIGSLAASALAAILLWRVRGQVGTSRAVAPKTTSKPAPPASVADTPVGDSVWVIDGQPDYHRQDCQRLRDGEPEQIARGQAKEDGFTACADCAPDAAPATPRCPTPLPRPPRRRCVRPVRVRRAVG